MDMKILILLACIATFASGTKYRLCEKGNPYSEIIDVDFDGCPDSDDPCRVEFGSSKEVTITFKPTRRANDLKTDIQIWYYLPVEYENTTEYLYMPENVENFDRDSCAEGSGITCPVLEGETYTYKGTVEFKSDYPSREERWVQWELYNIANIVCVEVKVELVAV